MTMGFNKGIARLEDSCFQKFRWCIRIDFLHGGSDGIAFGYVVASAGRASCMKAKHACMQEGKDSGHSYLHDLKYS